MNAFVGVDITKLQKFDLGNYTMVRDKFIQLLPAKISVLQTRKQFNDLVAIDYDATVNVMQINELQATYARLQTLHANIKKHMHNHEMLRVAAEGGNIQYASIIPYLPDIGIRKTPDGQGIIILNVPDLLGESGANIDAVSNDYSIDELYNAMLIKNWQNTLDYLDKLARVSCESKYAENTIYQLSYKIACLLDIYLCMYALPKNLQASRHLLRVNTQICKAINMLMQCEDLDKVQNAKTKSRYKMLWFSSCINAQPPEDANVEKSNQVKNRSKLLFWR